MTRNKNNSKASTTAGVALYNTDPQLWKNYGESVSKGSPTGAVSLVIHEDGTISNSREALGRFATQSAAKKVLAAMGYKISKQLGMGPTVKNLQARYIFKAPEPPPAPKGGGNKTTAGARTQFTNAKAIVHWQQDKYHTSDEISVGWEMDGARFHIWLDKDGKARDGRLYKNPPEEIKPCTPGFFNTRYLDATAQANALIIAEVLSSVNVEVARQEFAAKEKREQEERDAANQQREATERLNAAAPELLAERQAISKALGEYTWTTPEHAEQILKEFIEKFYDSDAVDKATGTARLDRAVTAMVATEAR